MNNQIVYISITLSPSADFPCCVFIFAASGDRQGGFDHVRRVVGRGSALDWAAGFQSRSALLLDRRNSFGAWIGMQLLMRRPEIEGFCDCAAPNRFDFSFSRPVLPPVFSAWRSGSRRPLKEVTGLIEKLKPRRHSNRACSDSRRQSFLRELHRAFDRGGRTLSRPPPRQSAETSDADAQRTGERAEQEDSGKPADLVTPRETGLTGSQSLPGLPGLARSGETEHGP